MTAPITIQGLTFKSQREAARHFNFSENSISKARIRGTLGNIGRGRNLNNAKPVTYNGVTYPSLAEMKRQLKLSDNAAKKLLGRLPPRGTYG